MSCNCNGTSNKKSACNNNDSEILTNVKNYYGEVLKKTADLKTNACCTSDSVQMSPSVKEALAAVHQDIHDKYYGCGIVLPESLQGLSVLDLGCGAGRDCFALSKLVGEKGKVLGIDMTDAQLSVADKYVNYHSDLFGFDNVEFRKGYIEDLSNSAKVDSNSMDLVVSNCVINLSPNKQSVLSEAYRVLKTGGELYFGDVYCNKVLTPSITSDKVLWGECIAGALYWKDLIRICELIGFSSPRLCKVQIVTIGNDELKSKLGDANFASITYRMFKLPKEPLDDRMINSATYLGGIEDHEDLFTFDHHMIFKKGEQKTITNELTRVLKISRFANKFKFETNEKGCCGGVVENKMDPFALLANNSTMNSCCDSTMGC